jgi:hypothetical protein
MPKPLEMKLKREALKKGLAGQRADAYTYGTMHNIRHKKKKKAMTGTAKAGL